jgi:hypothetical protein
VDVSLNSRFHSEGLQFPARRQESEKKKIAVIIRPMIAYVDL